MIQEKEKSALATARAKLRSCQKEVENLRWEVEVVTQKYDRAASKCAKNATFRQNR